MPDYEKMYKILFNAMTNAIHELQEVQCKTEEIFITSPPPAPLIVLPRLPSEDKDSTED